jgi:zinc transport system substrate-binding protein
MKVNVTAMNKNLINKREPEKGVEGAKKMFRRLKKKGFWSVFLSCLTGLFFLTFFTGCGQPGVSPPLTETNTPSKPIVYASIYPLYDFTRQIGGDKIIVRQLVPSNAEPHDWEPAAKDLMELQKAGLFIYNGAGMEPWLDKVSATFKETNCILVDASSGINLLKWAAEEKTAKKEAPETDREPKAITLEDKTKDEHNHEGKYEHEYGLYDPHIWLDPGRAKQQAANIKEALVKISPENKETFTSNYRQLAAAMDELDGQFKAMVEKAKHKEFVVVNPAFAYLADRYHLKQVAILGLCTEGEPSPEEMQKLVDFARQRQIKYLLFEETYSPKVAQTLAQETKIQTLTLNAVHGLTVKDKESGKDYLKVMKQNLENLKLALEA